MKKSEALKTLGLSEGATAEDIKKAHRKLAIENHPDHYGQDADARAQAEERMKLINEARDVLESGKWEPENATYGTPFTYNPYGGAASTRGSSVEDDFFSGFPFGSSTFVWTTYGPDGTRHTYTSNRQGQTGTAGSSNGSSQQQDPFGTGSPFDSSPFGGSSQTNPFAGTPFESFVQTKTADALLAEETSTLKQHLGFLVVKLMLSILAAAFVSPALGFYSYTILTIGWGLFKNVGFMGYFLIVPLVFLAFIFAPGPMAHIGILGLIALVCAIAWDINEIQHRASTIKSLKDEIGA